MDEDMILPDDFVEETSEFIETEKEYSEVITTEEGLALDEEEISYWKEGVSHANDYIKNGGSKEEAEAKLRDGFNDFIVDRDIKEYAASGKDINIPKEAMDLYKANIGKKSLIQCVEETDPFHQGFYGDDYKAQSRRTSKIKDDFLEGFMSV